MFLLTNTVVVFIQYSAILLTPSEIFRNSFLTDALMDSITDGVKYAGFTNHILQAILLIDPTSMRGTELVNASRLYMEDVLLLACLCSPVVAAIIEVNRPIRFLYILYALFVWSDYILKRFKPENFPRRKISLLAAEVRENFDSRNQQPGQLREPPSERTGFPLKKMAEGEDRNRELMGFFYYILFFFVNNAMRPKVYIPFTDFLQNSLFTVF
ncbi:hypothetical protein BDQ17DRAFT_1347041 [Cyathus striatus]|nr:hypothetical protein BDQ17DRAFT_1347041 [Cyathus striatus]